MRTNLACDDLELDPLVVLGSLVDFVEENLPIERGCVTIVCLSAFDLREIPKKKSTPRIQSRSFQAAALPQIFNIIIYITFSFDNCLDNSSAISSKEPEFIERNS